MLKQMIFPGLKCVQMGPLGIYRYRYSFLVSVNAWRHDFRVHRKKETLLSKIGVCTVDTYSYINIPIRAKPTFCINQVGIKTNHYIHNKVRPAMKHQLVCDILILLSKIQKAKLFCVSKIYPNNDGDLVEITCSPQGCGSGPFSAGSGSCKSEF